MNLTLAFIAAKFILPSGRASSAATIEQDSKLREIAEKTGRKISELAREAVEEV